MNFRFDLNEWCVIIASVILMTLFFRIRKHFSPIVILSLWIFNVTYVATVDYALAATPFNLYECLDNETYEPIAAVSHAFMYTPFSFFFLYFYDRWRISGMKLVLYLACWTSFSLLFEWINIQFGFLTYTGWKLYDSIPTYLISAIILINVYTFLKRNLTHENHLLAKPERT